MILGVDAVILWTSHVEEMLAFYWSLGVALQLEDHGDGGPAHYAADVDDVHFAIFVATDPASDALIRGQAGAVQISFRVESLDEAVVALKRIGARVLIDREPGPWGLRVVVEDPDGRPVQVTQRRADRAGTASFRGGGRAGPSRLRGWPCRPKP